MPAIPSAPERLFGTSATLRDHDRSRVLVIGGTIHATETLVELLEALGYQVQSVSTGSAARFQQIPDAIITDMCLPEGPACEVLSPLRRQYGWSDVPAIALGKIDSVHPDQEEGPRFAAVLPKPISIWSLHRALQDVLATRHPRQQRRR